jgi:hypothetical protein
MKSIFTFIAIVISIQIIAQTEFQKHLSTFQKSDSHELPDGILFRGTAPNGMDKVICKVDANGNVAWQKFYSVNSPIVNSIMAVASDTVYYHCAMVDAGKLAIFKTKGAEIEWNKEYSLVASVVAQNYSWGITKISVLENGDICVFGISEVPTLGGFAIAYCPWFLLLDSVGTLLWSNMYQLGTHSFIPNEVAENLDGDLIFLGTHHRQDVVGLITISGIGSMLIDRTSGLVLGSGGVNTYIDMNSELSFRSYSSENQIVVANALNLFGESINQSSSFLFRLNNDATFGNAQRLDATDPNHAVLLENLNSLDQDYFLSGSYSVTDVELIYTSVHPFCAKADINSGTVYWAKKYSGIDEGQIDKSVLPEGDGVLLSGWLSSISAYLWKADRTTGNAACNSEDSPISITDFSFQDSLFIPSLLYPAFIESGVDGDLQDNILVDGSLSVTDVCTSNNIFEENESAEKLFLFPNPAKTTVTIENSDRQPCLIEFVNTNGKTVLKTQSQNGKEEVLVSGLCSGIYFLRVTSLKTGNCVTRKLVIY